MRNHQPGPENAGSDSEQQQQRIAGAEPVARIRNQEILPLKPEHALFLPPSQRRLCLHQNRDCSLFLRRIKTYSIEGLEKLQWCNYGGQLGANFYGIQPAVRLHGCDRADHIESTIAERHQDGQFY
jgi:hypothetical protein